MSDSSDTAALAIGDTTDSAALAKADTSSPSQADSDTSARTYDTPFVGFGLGWSLGSMPLFDEWREGLPDSVGSMPNYAAYADSYHVTDPRIEPADAYTTAFPLAITVAPFVDSARYISIHAGFTYMTKNYLSTWDTDSAGIFWQVERTLSLIMPSIGLSYNYRIPSKLFAVANIDRAYLTVGLSASPYVFIKTVAKNTSTIASIRTDTEQKHNGYAAIWQGGISTLRPLSDRAGLEVGVLYVGGWFGRFMEDEHHVKWTAVKEYGAENNRVLNFMVHRFKVYFNVLIGKKAGKGSAQTPSESQPQKGQAGQHQQSEPASDTTQTGSQ
jgi:hypothetical protein